jgi:acetolactate synthase-1/2/3 large subunit
VPVLVLAGEVPRNLHGRRALQEGSAHHLDVAGMCRHVSKLALEVPFSDVAPAMLKRAIATAMSGRRGPVVLTLPLDITSAPIRTPALAEGISLGFGLDAPNVDRAIRDAADALRCAKRPVIFAGAGSRWGRAPQNLRATAERLQIPVMTRPKGKGVFPESHPLSLGVFGHGGHPSSRAYLEDGIDTIMAIGTGLSDPATDGWSPLLAAKTFIHVDADAMQLGRNYPITHGIVGDAEGVLGRLLEVVGFERREARRFGVERASDASSPEHGTEDRITPPRALWEIQRSMPKGTIYTSDIGEHLLFATHYLEIDEPDGFIAMTGLASMGSGVPGAIGAKLARPERPVVAICGDGGFSMSAGDVAVAARYRIPVVVAVFNDLRYGMVEIGNRAVHGRTASYSTAPYDVAEVAAGVGARVFVAERSGDILRLDLAGCLAEGPVVIDVRIDRNASMPKNKRYEQLRAVARPRALN